MKLCVIFSQRKQQLIEVLQAIRRECRGIVYCEYSTGSRIDRKNQRMREAEQVANWILILLRWLVAMPDRAARVLETGWSAVLSARAVGIVADWTSVRWGWRRFERGSPGQDLLYLRSICWMTNCLGQGWTSAPLGLLPALVSRATGPGVCRFAFCRAAGFIHNDHFLSCAEDAPGHMAPALDAWGHSNDFSMPAYAADL